MIDVTVSGVSIIVLSTDHLLVKSPDGDSAMRTPAAKPFGSGESPGGLAAPQTAARARFRVRQRPPESPASLRCSALCGSLTEYKKNTIIMDKSNIVPNG